MDTKMKYESLLKAAKDLSTVLTDEPMEYKWIHQARETLDKAIAKVEGK